MTQSNIPKGHKSLGSLCTLQWRLWCWWCSKEGQTKGQDWAVLDTLQEQKKRNRNQNCELSWSWLWSPSLMPYGSISIGEASWLYKRWSHHCVQLRDSLACHRCPADIFGSESLQTPSPFGCCSTKTRKYSVSGKVWQESFRRFHLRCWLLHRGTTWQTNHIMNRQKTREFCFKKLIRRKTEGRHWPSSAGPTSHCGVWRSSAIKTTLSAETTITLLPLNWSQN